MAQTKIWKVVHVYSNETFDDIAWRLTTELNRLAVDGWEIEEIVAEAPGHVFIVAWSVAA